MSAKTDGKTAETLDEALSISEAPEGMRVLLIEDSTGEIKITIPDTYKVTYGVTQPGHDHSMSLRVWRTKDQQYACFRNVLAFRDLSIPMERSRVDGENIVWETADDTFRLSPRGNAAQADAFARY